jgi:DUF4097 and DUF4098 domain-containing protein YvlB
MMNKTSLLRALVVMAALIPPVRATAQSDDAEWLRNCRDDRGDRWDHRETYCEIRTATARPSGDMVSMEGLRNGGVQVTGWDRNEISVKTRIRAQARTQSEAKSIADQVRTVINGSTITVDGPRTNGDDDEDYNQWSASLVTSVPSRSNLRVETRNGPVSVSDVKGDMNIQTRNGPMALYDLAGTVTARTTNGPLSISLSGNRWDGGGLDARTTNGPLTISIPENYSAHLETGTTNGPVSLGFPVTVSGRINRDITTDLGSGGPTIRAMTTNGPLTLRRK